MFLGSCGVQLRCQRTSTTSLHAEHDIGRVLRSGVACGHIRDEGGLDLLLVQCFHAIVYRHTLPSFLHCANVFLIASMVFSIVCTKKV